MAGPVLTLRAREWIAWSVSLTLDLWPALKERHVQAIVEPRFDTDLLAELDWWAPHLHPLIVRRVLAEARAGEWANTRAEEPSPPPIIRR